VHDNLDLLYALRLLVNRTDDVGMLLRAALIVEVYSLIELAIGPPRGEKPARDGASLVDFVDRQRGEEGLRSAGRDTNAGRPRRDTLKPARPARAGCL
jgi:hypothetical protein